MKIKLARLLLFITLFSPLFSISQKGKDADYVVTVSNTILNTYTYLTTNANAGATSIIVDNNTMNGGAFSSNLAAGDLIMIIQMQGASMDIDTLKTTSVANGGWNGNFTNPYGFFWDDNWLQDVTKVAQWGKVLNYNNAGKYEQIEVSGVAGGNTINLNCGLQNSYTVSGHVQIVRVPRFNNLTLNTTTTLVPPVWNGQVGGVVVVEVNGNLILNANSKITASARGFRGALANNTGNIGTTTQHLNGAGNGATQMGSKIGSEGARKGEGIGGYITEYATFYSSFGRGATANGGGGGGYQNAGGGGGSNIGSGTYTGKGVPSSAYAAAIWNLELAGFAASSSPGGGRGGYSLSSSDQNETTLGPNRTAWAADARKENGGLGGHPLAYDATRLFMGGGGGAGDQDSGQGGAGGIGGGIVFVTCYGTISGSGTLESDGAVGQNTNPTGQLPGFGQKRGNDGAGGGGAGGSIYIKNSAAIPATVAINARGGNGGNHNLTLGTTASSEASGPGGGGSGGNIAFTSGIPVMNVSGGINGTTNSSQLTQFLANGATNGATGVTGLAAPTFNITASNVTLCSGSSTTLTAIVTGTLPGTLNWYSQQFGGSSIGTGTTYTTPVLTATTTYYVGVCPGTFRIPVVVTVNPNPVINGTAVLTNPSCLAPGSITGLTVSSGTPNYTYVWSGATTVSPDYTNIPAGTYTLTVTDQNNCSDTDGPHTLVGTGGPIINQTNQVVQNENCNGTLGSIGGITAAGTGLIYSWSNGGGAAIDASNLSAGTYTLTVTDGNGCVANSTPITVGFVSGPTIDVSGINISPATCGNANGAISGITSSGASLSYTWNGISNPSLDLSNQLGGNYTVVVTDGNGCTASSGPHVINSVAGPTISAAALVITPENCNQTNGSIVGLTINGGTPVYTLAWTGTVQSTLDISNLASGNYTLTVTDQNGCVATSGPHAVTNVGGPTLNQSNVSTTNVLCDGTLGSINGITATGTGLNYSWSNGGGNNLNATNLVAGSYQLTVTDGNSCTVTSATYTINAPIALSINSTNMVVTQTSCTANTGSISGIVLVGGVNPTSTWSNSTNTLDLTNLSAGNYTLTATDDQGCTASLSVAITMVNAPVIDTNNMILLDEHCGQNNASISGITVSGGTAPYNTVWNSNPSLNTLNLATISSGNYNLVVTDSQGCSDVVSINVSESGASIINSNSILVQQLTCNSSGSIAGLIINGTAPYSYSWTNTTQTTVDISNLQAGSYTLTLTDGNGCISSYGPVVLSQPAGPIANFTWSPSAPAPDENVIFTNTSQGTSIVSSTWTISGQQFISEDTQFTFTEEGDYIVSLQVMDAAGCVDTIDTIVTIYGVLVIPNVMTLNGDNVNDSFEIKGLKPNTSLVVVNRWGNVVFNTDDYQNNWSGKDVSGNELTDGVYTYILKGVDGKVEHGFVHLLR